MKGAFRKDFTNILKKINQLEKINGPLLGLTTQESKQCWAEQIISSLRRIEYTNVLLERPIAPLRSDPKSQLFDPIRAVILLNKTGQLNEATWLTFILTHFGKHALDGWKLTSNVYGSFGNGPIWNYANYQSSQSDFENMLIENEANLRDLNISGRYSNHRKFQSKKPEAIAKTFSTYYNWQSELGDFRNKIIAIHKEFGQEPRATFHGLYHSMNKVHGFGGGRLGRFDFLTMMGKLQLAPIIPGSVYLDKASGPLDGARLLFYGNRKHPITGKALEPKVDELDKILDVGKQVIEDSLCNWQKSPEKYIYFRG